MASTMAKPGREDHLQTFRQLCSKVLTVAEQERLQEVLGQYQHNGDVSKLVRRAAFLWSSPSKLQLLPFVRKLVAPQHRPQFDLLLDIHHGLVVDRVRARPVEKSLSMSSSRSGSHPVGRRGGIHVIRIRSSDSPRLGFSIRGGEEFGLGIYVSQVESRSPAEESGLRTGDEILEANGVDLEKTTSQHAAELLSSAHTLTLVIRRTRKVPEWKVTKERILWYDTATKKLVPASSASGEVTPVKRPGAELKEVTEKKIILHLLRETDFLGFNIRGGKEFGLGVYVSRVDKGGLAQRAGIQVGDQLVSVNKRPLTNVRHAAAVEFLRSSRRLVLIVWAVGKFPAYKELFSEYVWSDCGEAQGDSYARSAEVPEDACYRPNAGHLTQRARTHETRVDLSPRDSGIAIDGVYADIDLDDNNDDLQVQQELFYPRDQDIIFRGDYSKNWRQLDRIYGEDFELKAARQSPSLSSSREAEHERDPDSSDSDMDYMTFLARKMRRDEMRSTLTAAGSQRDLSTLAYDRPVIKAISVDNIARTNSHEIYAEVHKPPRRSSRSSRSTGISTTSAAADNSHVQSDSSKSSVDLRDVAVNRSSSRSHHHHHHRPQVVYVNGSTAVADSSRNADSQMGNTSLQPPTPARRSIPYDVTDDDYTVVTEVVEEATTSFRARKPDNHASADASLLPQVVPTEGTASQTAGGTHPVVDEDYTVVTEVLEEATTSFSSASLQSESLPAASEPQATAINHDEDGSSRSSSSTPTVNTASGQDAVKPQTAVNLLTEEIKRLEARKSSLGSREISLLSDPHAKKTETEHKLESEKKGGTWSAWRKKLTTSVRLKKTKKREAASSSEPFVVGSVQRKPVVENSQQSQLTGQQSIDEYNMMIVQDRSRLLLTEDETDAVLRHVKTYHENHDVERLVELLLAILDKPEKIQLLKDIRGVIYAHHIGLFDSLVARHESATFEKLSTKVHLPLSPVHRQNSSAKPRSKLITTVLDEDGHFHIKTIEQHERNVKQQADVVTRMRRDSPEQNRVDTITAVVHGNTARPRNITTTHLPPPPDWRDDIEVIILEKDPVPPKPAPSPIPPAEEGMTVYVSKQKKNLGLIVCGGASDYRDQSIRIEMVMPWGAAADDDRIQPGMQILSADGQSLKGMTQSEAIAVLKSCFNDKRSVNMKLVLKNP